MRSNYRQNKSGASGLLLWDAIFFALAALYAWLAFRGILSLSADGVLLDSDLQTYAQGMAGAAHPLQFASDPVLAKATEANSIPNLQRWLATIFTENGNFGSALLKAGACAIFLFFSCWYILGRFLFKAPSLAALLAICSGITIWVGWGTFWGVTHSDPVPRVFFAAVFSLLLILAILSCYRLWLRPITMLFCGACMWIHGVSALNCGAMFLCAFFFITPSGVSFRQALTVFLLCVFCFLLPVCLFLWPSLHQGKSFSAEDLAIFQEMQRWRWKADFTGFWPRMAAFFSPSSPPFLLSLLGLAAWFLPSASTVSFQYATLRKMLPFFVLAIFAVAIFSWLESEMAQKLGRLEMGHELVRGMRFLVPLSWLLIIGSCALFSGKWMRRFLLFTAITLVGFFNMDRQHIAAETAIAEICGIEAPEKARLEMEKARQQREIIEQLMKTVPDGETVFCPEDQMPVRFLAIRPLAHSFKDGYVFFYDKDLMASQHWLALEKALKNGGVLKAWQLSGALWLLVRKEMLENTQGLAPKMDLHGWLLFEKKPDA